MKFSLPTSTTSELFKTNLEKENFEKILEEFNDKYNIFRDPDKLEELLDFIGIPRKNFYCDNNSMDVDL